MCRLVESLCIKNGNPVNLDFHQHRLNNSRKEFLNLDDILSIQTALDEKLAIPSTADIVNSHAVCKCRIVYKEKIESIETAPYRMRQVKSLKLVYPEHIDYRYKYADRRALDQLKELKGDCDDILIVVNNCITDTSYSSVLFFDGKEWITPDTYLLPGTKRAALLSGGIIKERRVEVDDLSKYKKARIVNAMIDFEDERDILAENIYI